MCDEIAIQVPRYRSSSTGRGSRSLHHRSDAGGIDRRAIAEAPASGRGRWIMRPRSQSTGRGSSCNCCHDCNCAAQSRDAGLA